MNFEPNLEKAKRRIAEAREKGLTELDLSGLYLTALPDELKEVGPMLTGLNLGYNKVGDNGAWFIAEYCPGLVSLMLNNNSIGAAGAMHLCRLSGLTVLDLRDNSIGDAGAEHVSRLSGLTALTLTRNSIGDAGAEHVSRLSGLTVLDLTGNSIGDAGAEHVSRLSGLTALNLSFNSIGAAGAEHVSRLRGLTSLNLSFNSIGAAGAEHVSRLSGLTKLDLSANSIGDAGATILSRVRGLTKLYLVRNSIGDEGLKALATSRFLAKTDVDISQNKPIAIPQEATSRFSTLQAYFASIAATTDVKNNVIRLVLCGNTMAGKSSFVAKLTNTPMPIDKDRTHGIQHRQTTRFIKNDEYFLNIWDFGGHDYYHATHAASLYTADKAKRAQANDGTLYLLFWHNCIVQNQERDQDMSLDYWLGFIEQMADCPALELVQTHADIDGQWMAFPVSELIKGNRFGLSPENFHFLSLTQVCSEDVKRKFDPPWEQFNRCLETIIERKTQKKSISSVWKKIREEYIGEISGKIADEKMPVIGKEKLRKELLMKPEVHNSKDKDAALSFNGLLGYLKECGDILFWTEGETDNDLMLKNVVIDIEQFHEVIYKKLLSEEVKLNGGEFAFSDEFAFHIAYLAHYDLIFKTQGSDKKYVATQYLPEEPLVAHFRDLIPLTLALRFPYYMPRFLITKLIVKAYTNAPDATNYWKYGCISRHQADRLENAIKFMVCIDIHDQQVSIHVQEAKGRYKLLKELFAFFASLGEAGLWDDNENEVGEEDRKGWEKKEDRADYGPLLVSVDGKQFVRYSELQKAVNNNFWNVRTAGDDGGYIKINTTMQQIVKNTNVRPKKIFFSYSKNELQYCRELQSCFATLKRNGYVETFYDGAIEPGKEWDIEIKQQMEQADLVLCLLSRSFMDSDYIWNVEMEKAQQKLGKDHVIPIFISRCNYQGTFLSELGGLLNVKHLPSGYTHPSNDNGTIWIAMEQHQPTRDFYYDIILEKLSPIIKR